MHIPFSKKGHFVGTASFSSVNSHEMMEQSRRDDLESLANVMIFMKKGKLPWLRVKINDKMSKRTKYNLVAKKKKESKIEDITSGLPIELYQFYYYCRYQLDFYEAPDYGYLKTLLYSVIFKESLSSPMCFSWQISPNSELQDLERDIKDYR